MNHPHPAIQRAYEKMVDRANEVDANLLECERCGHRMVVRNTQLSEEPCRNDIRLKCPTTDAAAELVEKWGIMPDGCGWWTRHGIPISRGEYTHEMAQLRDQQFVDAVTTETPDSTVEERLSALGYLDE